MLAAAVPFKQAGELETRAGGGWHHCTMLRAASLVLALVLGLAAETMTAQAAPVLRVEGGRDPAIVDARDREVLLRGVNVNQLGDYYAADPELPTVVPLRRADFARIAGLGFNVVRLVVNWSAFQPRPAAFRQAYAARVRRATRWAAEHRLAIVLDMHQDAWGKHIATPPGTTCPPGFGPAVGWDGAPAWATRTDGMTTCRAADTRELSPAVAQAFTSFYADRDGIQSQLVATWGRIAAALAREPNVVGYDLLNEPHPGFAAGAGQSAGLGRFYARAIAAIRDGERRAGAPRRLVFFEPSVIWSGFGVDALPPPGFTADDRIVFAPHLYLESISVDRGLGLRTLSIEQGFDLAEGAAALYGAPLWSGEWGWFGEPVDNLDRLERYAAQEDARGLGGAWWVWRQACGDPHVVGHPGASGSLNPLECPGGRQLPLVTGYTDVLRRAYPRALPGRLSRLASDWRSGRWDVHGGDPRPGGSCRLVVWVPGREPQLDGEEVAGLVVRWVSGGFIASGCARRSYRLAGRPAPQGRVHPGKRRRGHAPAPACTPASRVSVALPTRPGVRLREVTVRVDGVARGRLHGHRRTVRVGLGGGRGSVRAVSIDARTSDGRRLGWYRVYRRCGSD